MKCTYHGSIVSGFLRSPDMISKQSNSLPFLVEATHFHLYKRAKHVLSEARRVLQFRKTCLRAAAVDPLDLNHATGFLETLGHLMNESQESCAELFECSCPELDELTRLAREAGALGSRLTGSCFFLLGFVI